MLCALVMLVLTGYWSGESAGLDRLRSNGVIADVADLQRQIERLDREREVDQTAIEQARQTIRDLEQEIAQLNQDITFYRSVMAPELLVEGLQIEKVRFEPLRQTGRYELHWVITQPGKNNEYAEGRLALELVGEMGETTETLQITDLGVAAEDLAYKFKYFQQFSLQLELPDSFTLQLLRFIFPTAQGEKPLQYEWAVDEQEMISDVER